MVRGQNTRVTRGGAVLERFSPPRKVIKSRKHNLTKNRNEENLTSERVLRDSRQTITDGKNAKGCVQSSHNNLPISETENTENMNKRIQRPTVAKERDHTLRQCEEDHGGCASTEYKQTNSMIKETHKDAETSDYEDENYHVRKYENTYNDDDDDVDDDEDEDDELDNEITHKIDSNRRAHQTKIVGMQENSQQNQRKNEPTRDSDTNLAYTSRNNFSSPQTNGYSCNRNQYREQRSQEKEPRKELSVNDAEIVAKELFDDRVKFFEKIHMEFSNPFDDSAAQSYELGFGCLCREVLMKIANKGWSDNDLREIWKKVAPFVRLKIAKLRTSKAQACKKAFTEMLDKNNGEVPFTLEDILDMRKSDKFVKICKEFVPKMVGKTVWNMNANIKQLSEFCSPTTEAFMILILENNWEMWTALAKKRDEVNAINAHDNSIPGTKYTSNQFGGRNPGWTEQGVERYLELCDLVQEDRNGPHCSNAENDLLREMSKTTGGGSARKKSPDEYKNMQKNRDRLFQTFQTYAKNVQQI